MNTAEEIYLKHYVDYINKNGGNIKAEDVVIAEYTITALEEITASQSSTPLQEEEIEKLAEKEFPISSIDGNWLDVPEKNKRIGFIAGYKAARVDEQSKDLVVRDTLYEFAKFMNQWLPESEQFNDVGLKNIIRDFVPNLPITDSEPVASHTCTDNNSIQQCERILCSAIWFDDGKEYVHQPKNVKSGFVVAGRRHNNCYSTLQAIGSSLGLEGIARNHIERIDRDKQGFITNLNRYVDRKEGFQIAQKAGQLLLPELHSHQENPILTSEDLW